MNHALVHDDFDHPTEGGLLHWHCPPQRWALAQSQLLVWPDPRTDFWQRTHYGFQADNGHFLGCPVTGDFVASTRVHTQPLHQYDQAGLMVRYHPECWIKTAIEFEPDGPNRLGAVVTQSGYSDWSTQDVPREWATVDLRIHKHNQDFTVEYRLPHSPPGTPRTDSWTQLRLAHLHPTTHDPLHVGLYACSPNAAGFRAAFDHLHIDTAAPDPPP